MPMESDMPDKPTYEELEQRILDLEKAKPNIEQNSHRLREKETQYNAFLEYCPMGLAIFDREFRYVYINEVLREINGPSLEEHIGHTIEEVLPKAAPIIRPLFEKILSDCEPVLNIELSGEVPSKPNEITHYLASYFPVDILKGRPQFIGGIVVDITDRIRALEQFNKIAKDHATILDNVPAYIYFKDRENNIIRISESVAAITGKPKSEIEGRHSSEIYPETADKYWADDLEVIESGKAKTGIIEPLPVADGETRWLMTDKIPYRDGHGEVAGVLVICNDITDRIHAENKVRESEERFILAQNAGKVGIWEVDLETRQVVFSDEFARIHGVEKRRMDLDTMLKWALPADQPIIQQAALQAEKPGSEITAEYRIMRQDTGALRWVTARGTAIERSGRRLPSIYGTIQDITRRKHAEEERDQLQSRLRQIERMESIGNLAGGIAHDFNNILSSIIGFTELALDDAEKKSAVEDSLKEVLTAGLRARDLVKQILAFARQSDEEIKPVQVNAIVQEVLKLIRSTIPTNIDIKDDLRSKALIMGNASQLHQLLMNLLTNAAQAMEDTGGILNIRLTEITHQKQRPAARSGLEYGNYLELTVSDTGPGIPPEIIDSVFEPYFTTKGVGEGTGMGLAMVHGIVETYGGKIYVNSQLDKGTTFSVYLPTTQTDEKHHSGDIATLPSGAEHILVVDDELPIAKITCRTLERLGYKVTVRTSSVEALELFRARPEDFDLIITDMAMPNMTGADLAVELIAARPDIPVILCTGYSKKINDLEADKIGIKALAYKPIVKADLANTVRKVLDMGPTAIGKRSR